jgi:predicted nucleotidyltransferase
MGEAVDETVDIDAVVGTLDRHPVRCAVLYGSHAHGTATADSDIDIAVGFEQGLPAQARLDRRIDLVVELTEALGTDDIDVADLDAIRPEVGLTALNTGHVLVGDVETVAEYRDRFERDVTPDETHEERIEQFDAVLDRLEEKV